MIATSKTKHVISAAGRRRISQVQKARWAKQKSQKMNLTVQKTAVDFEATLLFLREEHSNLLERARLISDAMFKLEELIKMRGESN